MRVLMIGVNHKTASVETRERLAFSGAQVDSLLEDFRSLYPQAEAVLISTCNRTELYIARPSHESPATADVADFLAKRSGLSQDQMQRVLMQNEGDDAVMHLLRVCCGLDSMVLGEPQVLGQIKRAYEQANQNQAVGPILHKCFQHALASAKAIRLQTGIDTGRLSIGSVAVDFARQIFATFHDKTVLAVGAGDMAKVTLKHLLGLEPKRLIIVNRTLGRAQALAIRLAIPDGRGGTAPLENLPQLLVDADIVVSSTGSTTPIITQALLKPIMKLRRNRPLFLIDIAVPRDVSADVQELENVYAYNLDDLQQVVAENMGQRLDQVQACEALIRESAKTCLAQLQHRDVGQIIRAFRTKLHAMGESELARTSRKLQGASAEEIARVLEEHNHRLINKILHVPLSRLDTRDHQAPIGYYASALRKLFELEETGAMSESDKSTASAAGVGHADPAPAEQAIPAQKVDPMKPAHAAGERPRA